MIRICFDFFDEPARRAQVTTLKKLLSCQLPDSQTIRGRPLSPLRRERMNSPTVRDSGYTIGRTFKRVYFWFKDLLGMYTLDMKKA